MRISNNLSKRRVEMSMSCAYCSVLLQAYRNTCITRVLGNGFKLSKHLALNSCLLVRFFFFFFGLSSKYPDQIVFRPYPCPLSSLARRHEGAHRRKAVDEHTRTHRTTHAAGSAENPINIFPLHTGVISLVIIKLSCRTFKPILCTKHVPDNLVLLHFFFLEIPLRELHKHTETYVYRPFIIGLAVIQYVQNGVTDIFILLY